MATIVGHPPVPSNSGYSAPETLTGTSENDTIDFKGGSDQIDGGSGPDSVLFFDSKSHFTITTLAGITHVNALIGAISPYGGDKVVMTNVEQIHFSDGSVTLSTTSSNTIFGNFPVPSNSGYSAPETLTGTSGNDTIDFKGGSDQIDGGSGTDTVLFFDSQSHFSITTLAGITHVNALTGAISPYGGSQVVLTNIERLQFSDKTIALDIEGNAGQAYRLYQAAFNRTPDASGLTFQTHTLDDGWGLSAIAKNFIDSPEFSSTYGSLNNTQFVTQLYQNVLHRVPDAGGLQYHVDHLNQGWARENILVGFSESPENQVAVIGVIQNGIELIG